MSIRAVVTRGFGSFGTVKDVTRRGYGASGVITPDPTPPQTTAGGKKHRRWWFLDGKRYWATQPEMDEIAAAVIADEPVETRVKVKRGKPKTLKPVDVVLPDLPDTPRDWKPLYVFAQQQDDPQLAAVITAAVQRWLEDEDDIESLLWML